MIEHSFTFAEAMDKFDPYGLFMNSFGRRIKREGTAVDIDPLTKHCALLANCICAKNTDCGPTQICTTIPGYNYNVCKTRNEPSETIKMDRSKIPPPFGILSFFLRNILTSVKTVFAKCSGKA